MGAPRLAAGIGHTCALTAAGGVKCWGWNGDGQLGDGTTLNQGAPVAVAGLTSGVTAVATGWRHTCALTAAGGVKCWGWNDYGQLGDGTTTNRLTPVDVAGLTSGVTALAAGNTHTCALTAAGGAKCWGYNYFGQLGDGTTTNRLTPVDVAGLTSGVTALAAGNTHTCALTADDGAKCWGSNDFGQLGDGTAIDRLAPVAVIGLALGGQALSASARHTCALTVGGGVLCWGSNYDGQLGDGTTTDRLTPVSAVGLTSGAAALAAGSMHTCAVLAAGGARCWGNNFDGQLGDSTTTKRLTPVAVDGLAGGLLTITAGYAHTCALTTGGGVKCWGSNRSGQLGDGTQNRSTPVTVAGLAGGAASPAAGGGHTCALTAAGGVQCWGWNAAGELGDGTTIDRLAPGAVSGLASGMTALAAGYAHACALTAGGGVQCWGANNGQLGDGTTTGRAAPVAVSGLASGVTALTAGYDHTCALTAGGGVKCWGANDNGKLGDGSTLNRLTPVEVAGLTSGAAAVAAGFKHTCALTAGGGVKCWGWNAAGQLGDGTTISRPTPVDVVGLTSGVTAIAAGYYHTCALTAGGGVKCWGANDAGQLGDGTTASHLTPVDVTGLTSGAAGIAAGEQHSCALTAGGGVKCWGANSSRQLGDASAVNRLMPVDVTGLASGVTALASGYMHTCALTAGSALTCWGDNYYGQLGDGAAWRTTPVEVVDFSEGVGFTLSGRVTAAGGAAVAGVTVSAGSGGGALTEASGSYTITNALAGTYTLAPAKPGYTFVPVTRTVDVPPNASGLDFTATYTPPIILLPDWQAAALTNTPNCPSRPSGLIWLDGTPAGLAAANVRLPSLYLAANGTDPANQCDQITPSGVIRSTEAGWVFQSDYYASFVTAMRAAGYEVYLYAYDWRLDLRANTSHLDTDLAGLFGGDKVNLVGHGMGGLLARDFVSASGRAARVERVITIGTPYWGAPTAAYRMRAGQMGLPIDPWLDPDVARTLIRNAPGAMQLLPSPRYLTQVGSYFRVVQDLWAADPAVYRQLFAAKGQNPALLGEAESFHSGLDDFGANPPPVPYTLLTADHRPTAVEVREYPCGFSQNGLCDDQIRFSLGDGTVPWLSAVAGTQAPNGSAGTVSVCTFHQASLGGESEHSTLLSAPAVITDVKRILLNLAPANCEGLPAAGGAVAGASAPPPFLQVTVWGDVSATVLDSADNVLGFANGVFVNGIPGAAYRIMDGGLALMLPVSSTYTLTLHSPAAQSGLVRVTDYRAAGPGEVFTPYQSAVFVEVPLVVSGTAQLFLDYTAGLAGLQVQLFDGQGAPAATLPPTSVLDQQQVLDLAPPLTTIAAEGAQTVFGSYTGPVTLTLSAADSGVGVLATDYSLDDGQTWQAYTAPLVVVAEQVPAVRARSVDLAGNQEYPGVSQRLQPQRLYLPIVGR